MSTVPPGRTCAGDAVVGEVIVKAVTVSACAGTSVAVGIANPNNRISSRIELRVFIFFHIFCNILAIKNRG